MKKEQFIKDITPSDAVDTLFLVMEASQQQDRNGRPYWRLALGDNSGKIEAKIWSPLSLRFPELAPGQIVRACGHVTTYREQLQLTVDNMEIIPEELHDTLPIEDFCPSSPRPVGEMWNELLELIHTEFTYAPWRKLVGKVFQNDDIARRFKRIPAAKAVHHAYFGGLLEHTLGVARLALRLAEQYPQLDRDVLLAGALFHDIGKIAEFSGGPVNDYTDEGRLIGHMELGLELLAPFLEKSSLAPALIQHLKHLILSHHGLLEFGAVRLPQTAEALMLHYADNIDAKMAQCRALYNNIPAENGWTPYQPTLERAMYKPLKTPGKGAEAENPRPKKTQSRESLPLLEV